MYKLSDKIKFKNDYGNVVEATIYHIYMDTVNGTYHCQDDNGLCYQVDKSRVIELVVEKKEKKKKEKKINKDKDIESKEDKSVNDEKEETK